jgi:hypothetical protein
MRTYQETTIRPVLQEFQAYPDVRDTTEELERRVRAGDAVRCREPVGAGSGRRSTITNGQVRCDNAPPTVKTELTGLASLRAGGPEFCDNLRCYA